MDVECGTAEYETGARPRRSNNNNTGQINQSMHVPLLCCTTTDTQCTLKREYRRARGEVKRKLKIVQQGWTTEGCHGTIEREIRERKEAAVVRGNKAAEHASWTE